MRGVGGGSRIHSGSERSPAAASSSRTPLSSSPLSQPARCLAQARNAGPFLYFNSSSSMSSSRRVPTDQCSGATVGAGNSRACLHDGECTMDVMSAASDPQPAQRITNASEARRAQRPRHNPERVSTLFPAGELAGESGSCKAGALAPCRARPAVRLRSSRYYSRHRLFHSTVGDRRTPSTATQRGCPARSERAACGPGGSCSRRAGS